jgi:hypothetical protein
MAVEGLCLSVPHLDLAIMQCRVQARCLSFPHQPTILPPWSWLPFAVVQMLGWLPVYLCHQVLVTVVKSLFCQKAAYVVY